jgi:hypothetical protein
MKISLMNRRTSSALHGSHCWLAARALVVSAPVSLALAFPTTTTTTI